MGHVRHKVVLACASVSSFSQWYYAMFAKHLIILCLIMVTGNKFMLVNGYTASVVLYKDASLDSQPAGQRLLVNSNHMAHLISKANEQGSDIIVFAENSFTGHDFYSTSIEQTVDYSVYVPNPADEVNLCNVTNEGQKYSKHLIKIACVAEEQRICVVINVLERINKTLIYNTNVVFDKNGVVIARCRRNLFTKTNISDSICNFTLNNKVHEILMGYDLLKNKKKFKKNQVYIQTTMWWNGLNDSIIPGAALNEMMVAKLNITLLSSTSTESGIFSPNRIVYKSINDFNKSEIISNVINTRRLVPQKYGMKNYSCKNTIRDSRVIKPNVTNAFFVQPKGTKTKSLDAGTRKYCSNNNTFCFTVTSTCENDFTDFRIIYYDSVHNLTRRPIYDDMNQETLMKVQFCGAIYVGDENGDNIDSPKIDIRMDNGTDLEPLVIESKSANNGTNKYSVDDNGLLRVNDHVSYKFFGFYYCHVFYVPDTEHGLLEGTKRANSMGWSNYLNCCFFFFYFLLACWMIYIT